MFKTHIWTAVAFLAVLGMGSAHGVDYDDGDNGTIVTDSGWNGQNVNITAGTGAGSDDAIITLANPAAVAAANLSISATENNAALIFGGSASATFSSASLTSSPDGIGAAEIIVGSGALVKIGGTTTVNVNSAIWVEAGGDFTTETMTLNAGGYLNVLGEYSSIFALNVDAASHGVDIAGTMTVVGTVSAEKTITLNGSGVLNLATTERVDISDLVVDGSGAVVNLSGVADRSIVKATVSSGELKVVGGSDIVLGAGSSIANAGGVVTVAAGGSIAVESFSQSAGTTNIDGTVDDATAFSASGGSVNVNAGSTFGSAATGLTSLSVGGTAAVDLKDDANTQSFAFSGGKITVRTGTALSAGSVSGNLAGNLVLDGGAFNAGSGFTAGSGARIESTSSGGRIAVAGGGSLTVASGAVIDASAGDIELNAAGGLDLKGGYKAGYTNSDVNMLTITGGGGLAIGDTAQVELSASLQSLAATTDFENEAILVLMTDSVSGSALTYEWDSNGAVYYYELRMNPNDGNKWGLYLVGSEMHDDEVMHQRLIDAWNRVKETDGRAASVIARDYGRAISRAYRLVMANDIGEVGSSRNFNARVLNSFLNAAELADVGYDALMLYNGSGIAMTNQAALDVNAGFMRLLGRRTSHVRNEYMSGLAIESETALASNFGQTLLPNRAWAAVIGQRENTSRKAGVKGYEYDMKGLAVGYDHLMGDLTIGGSFAYAGGDFKDKSALANDSEIATYAFALYGGYNHPSGLFITGAAGLGYSDNDIKDRRVLNGLAGWNKADYRTDTLMATLSVGYDWSLNEYLTVSPSIGFAHQRATSKSHRHRFVSDDGTVSTTTLNAGKAKNHSTTLPLDVAVSYEFLGDAESLITLTANIGWAHEFHNKAASGDVTYNGLSEIGPVGIVGQKPGSGIFNLGFSAKYTYKQFEFGAGYDYVHRKDYGSHNYSFSAGYNF